MNGESGLVLELELTTSPDLKYAGIIIIIITSQALESHEGMESTHFMDTNHLEVEGEADEYISDHSMGRPCSVCSHASSHSSRMSQSRKSTPKKHVTPPLQRVRNNSKLR